jgi:hypothetical protein
VREPDRDPAHRDPASGVERHGTHPLMDTPRWDAPAMTGISLAKGTTVRTMLLRNGALARQFTLAKVTAGALGLVMVAASLSMSGSTQLSTPAGPTRIRFE